RPSRRSRPNGPWVGSCSASSWSSSWSQGAPCLALRVGRRELRARRHRASGTGSPGGGRPRDPLRAGGRTASSPQADSADLAPPLGPRARSALQLRATLVAGLAGGSRSLLVLRAPVPL